MTCPDRSLETIEVSLDAGGPKLTCLCDCATVTDIALDGMPEHDFAWTCGGCGTTYWLWFGLASPEGGVAT